MWILFNRFTNKLLNSSITWHSFFLLFRIIKITKTLTLFDCEFKHFWTHYFYRIWLTPTKHLHFYWQSIQIYVNFCTSFEFIFIEWMDWKKMHMTLFEYRLFPFFFLWLYSHNFNGTKNYGEFFFWIDWFAPKSFNRAQVPVYTLTIHEILANINCY